MRATPIVLISIIFPAQVAAGTGEGAQGPAGAAIGNAIANATGKRFRDLPLTPQRIKNALQA